MKKFILIALLIILVNQVFSQGSTEYTAGLKVKINESGSQYFRLITWHQMWLRYNENNRGSLRSGSPQSTTTDIGLRRSRFLMFAQLNERFLVLTHFGINNQNAVSGGYLGIDGKKPQIYMHDAWGDWKVFKEYLHLGIGLHYWNGISRLSNASTLNLMTLDAPIFNWPTIEATDQFARHLGIFMKGKIGKFDYRLSLNEPFATNTARSIALDKATYNPNNTAKIYAGYMMYQFLEQESNVLPYMVGSYLGTKKVFNLGGGFHYNQRGMWHFETNPSEPIYNNIALFAVDAFLDLPLHEKKKDAITAYLAFYHYDFGPNHVRNIGIMNPSNGSTANFSLRGNSFPVVGTGSIYYSQIGYVLPQFSNRVRIQPYSAGSLAYLEGVKNSQQEQVPVAVLDIGTNFYLEGHHSKITINYRARPDYTSLASQSTVPYKAEITLQAMVYL